MKEYRELFFKKKAREIAKGSSQFQENDFSLGRQTELLYRQKRGFIMMI